MVRYELEWIEYNQMTDEDEDTIRVFKNKDDLIEYLCGLVPYGAMVRRL